MAGEAPRSGTVKGVPGSTELRSPAWRAGLKQEAGQGGPCVRNGSCSLAVVGEREVRAGAP